MDEDWLKAVLDMNNILIDHFWDREEGGFYFTPDDGEPLIVRKKEIYDGAVPSGNSVAMLNLLRLGKITANSGLEEKAREINRAFSKEVRESPASNAQLMLVIDIVVRHLR